MSQSAASKQELQEAFALFNQVSEQLAGSYQALQKRVVGLNRELAAARNERLQLLAEIRTLQQEASRGRRLSNMGEMTARLAHQIRTPLATALLYASQLKQPGLPDSQRHCFVDRLLVGLRHLDHMVNDMLVFARGGEPGETPLVLAELLAQVQQSIAPRLTSRAAVWDQQAVEAKAVIQGQRDILISVFGNLASNALDACSDSPRLEWRTEIRGNTLSITLTDNGPGVDAELADQIFEPFFTTRSNGTGLGLAVVRAVIVAHRGDIELDASYREGARFTVHLPLFAAGEQLPSRNLRKTQQAAIAGSRCV